MLIGQIKNTLSLLSITDISPVSLLLKCLPFIYYPFCAYLNACYIVWSQKSFGLMKIYENNALNLHERAIASCETKNSLWYEKFLFPTPFIVFFLFVIYDMISYSHIWSTRLEITMVHAIIVSIIVFCSILFFLKKIKVDQISTAFYSVLKENITSVLLLILAWMFAYSTKSLGAATLLTVFLKQHVSFLSLYVVLFFIFSFFLSLFTGSVWGVIALIMPLVTVVGNSSEILFLQFSIAAIISGSMAGSHFSPFSNAVLIAATGARCNIIDHFKTQWVYALGPLCGAFIGLSVSLLLSCYCSYNMIAFISLIFASLTTCFITYCLSRFLN